MDLATVVIHTSESSAAPKRQDQALLVPELGLAVVADAVPIPDAEPESTHGAVRIAIEAVRGHIARNDDLLERFRRHPTQELRERILTLVEEAFTRAAHESFALGRRIPGLQITLDLVLLAGTEAFVGHVGDGHVYLVRHGLVHQLTLDPSHDDPLIFADPDDEPPPRDAERPHPSRRPVPRSLGSTPAVPVESLCMELTDDDRFVLCPFCVHHAIPTGVLHHHLISEHLDNLADALHRCAPEASLVAAAIQVGGGTPSVWDRGRSRLAILQPMPLFTHCSERELRIIAQATHPRRLAGGTLLFSQGDPGTDLYLVIDGRVRIERDGKAIAHPGPGSNFGEMAMLDTPTRSATAIAEIDSELMVISREAFFALLRDNPKLAIKILWNLLLHLSANLRTTSAALARARRDVPSSPEH